ncbi:MAG: hypothetical protein NC489_42045, partial [Ruminococcus flavefaciens]|nr:hypothetical protein [Ruminococcus flavefaciens]
FLDANPEYTIYGTNAYIIYNDGMTAMKYDRSGIDTYTSTYEDFIHGKAVLSTTIASTYRNVYFADGIPEEYIGLSNSKYEESFRADTARNLIHLRKGKAYFINESVGYYRYHGNGLASGLFKYEKFINIAFGLTGYFEFFGHENEKEYGRMIKENYTAAIKHYYHELVFGKFPRLSEQCKAYFKEVMEWLYIHETEYGEKQLQIPFSLEKFGEMPHRKVIIWGTGLEAPRIIEKYHIPIHDDTFFIDNDSSKQGKEYMGKPIKSPETIKEEQDALIFIASSYYVDILRQIKEEKLCTDDRIINIYSYEKFNI